MTTIKEMLACDGSVAVITGGTGYLGAAMCEALLELGFNVVATSRGTSERFTNHLKDVDVLDLDLSTERDNDLLINHVQQKFGRLDVLINNICQWPKFVNFDEFSWNDAVRSITTNVVGPMHLSRLAIKLMKNDRKIGSDKLNGSIINVASMYAHVSPDFEMYRGKGGNAIEYGAAKAAIVQLTRYLAVIGGTVDVNVNSVSPGPFPRPGTFNDKEFFKEELEKRTVLKRCGSQHEMKGIIALLSSDAGSYITGTDISIDGGWTVR